VYPLGSIPQPLRQLAARPSGPSEEKSEKVLIAAPAVKGEETSTTSLLAKVRSRLRLIRRRP
jgi:hypothetical protein